MWSIERNWFEEGGETITEDKLVAVSEILVCESALQVFFYWPSSEGLKGHLVTAEPRRAQKSKFFTIQVIQSKVLFANFKTKHNKQHHVVETVLYESVSLS